jgi:nucleotide-binding universal stress UspA family protein
MFKRILVATDGSKLSLRAVRSAALLCRETGAGLIGVYVIEPYVAPIYSEGMIRSAGVSSKRYKAITAREAKKALAPAKIEAKIAGIDFQGAMPVAGAPWEGIVRTAQAKKCDLIVMASHGRRGIAGLLLGSETTKVLTHSKVPVLVYR